MGENKFFVIAGPCVVESKDILEETAGKLKEICEKFELGLFFKSSYRKANRTSLDSFAGIGDRIALEYLSEIRDEFGVKVLTDIHSGAEAEIAARYVDAIQIPAFLCRQTDILLAAGKTGKTINIKKGQFVSPLVMKEAVDKVLSTGNTNIWLTERGSFFGYHDLVVDFRSIVIMKEFGYPVIFDATHSVQQPSMGKVSGGLPQFSKYLARAAAAVGADGIFFETHPEPSRALSDSSTQIALIDVEGFLEDVIRFSKISSQNI